MAVAVKSDGPTFEAGSPRGLFKTRMLPIADTFDEYDVTADGQRFLVGTSIHETKTRPVTLIFDWTVALKK